MTDLDALRGCERHLRPGEVAQRAGINKRRVLRAIRDGRLSPYLAIADNSIRIPISAVNDRLRGFRVSKDGNQKDS